VPDSNAAIDLVFGSHQQSTTSRATDSILIKADHFPTYHFASVVDDHDMGITHVIRGEEWLSSLPLHLDIYAALSYSPPQYAHVPLLLNKDGTKMSKRKGDVQVSDFIRQGWEPEAVLNWLVLAGWGRHNDSEVQDQDERSPGCIKSPASDVLTLDELIRKFDLAHLTHRKSILDPTKLAYLNRQHVQIKLSQPVQRSAIVSKAIRILKEAFPQSNFVTEDYVEKALPSLTERLENLQDLPTFAPYLFTEPDFLSSNAKLMISSFTRDEQVVIMFSARAALERISHPEWGVDRIQAAISTWKSDAGFGQKTLMTVLRYALTGSRVGPSVVDIMTILGRRRTLTRLSPPLIAGHHSTVSRRP